MRKLCAVLVSIIVLAGCIPEKHEEVMGKVTDVRIAYSGVAPYQGRLIACGFDLETTGATVSFRVTSFYALTLEKCALLEIGDTIRVTKVLNPETGKKFFRWQGYPDESH